MNTTNQQKGFTIIEVVLVLAIAALIFLMIFVALPALQRGQANTARKNDMSTIASAVNTYRTNLNGSLPTNYSQLDRYVDNLSQLSLGTGNLQSGAGTMTADSTTLDTATVRVRAKCGTPDANGNVPAVAGTSRQAAVLTVVENSAGDFSTICQNS